MTPSMNAHNEQKATSKALQRIRTIASQAGTERQHGPQFVAGMRRAANLLEKAIAATPAAPVTAAPADLIERCKEILAWQRTGVLPGDALRTYANARWPDEHDPLQIAEKETAREAFRILARAAEASTPAAPGIDLSPFRELVETCEDVRAASDECDIGEGLANAVPFHLWNEFLSKLDAAQHVLDANPKGATFPNDGNSEAQFIADGERLNCPACGGSGHVEDSPKGGSEARDAARYRWLRDLSGNAPDDTPSVTVFEKDRDSWWYIDGPKLDAAIDAAMQAQAGDAEVQP